MPWRSTPAPSPGSLPLPPRAEVEGEAVAEEEVEVGTLSSRVEAKPYFPQEKQDQKHSRGRGRGRGGKPKFDKSPNKRKPRVNSKTPAVEKDRCFICGQTDHWKAECPQNSAANKQPQVKQERMDTMGSSDGYTSIRDGHITIPSPRNYFDQLSTIQDGLQRDDPLRDLNL